MRVAFSDPEGKRLWRMIPYGGPLALFLFACAGPLEGAESALTAVLAVALFHLVGVMPIRQVSARAAELTLKPGVIEVSGAGTRSQRIEARSIVGGTTARTKSGVLFTLSHANRDQPLTIEVATDADADAVRQALGIGHGGFGQVSWRTMPSSSAKAGFWGRLLTFAMGVVIAGTGFFGSHTAAAIVGVLLGQFALITMVLSLVGYVGRDAPPNIVMAAEGLRLNTKLGWFSVPYDHVLGIETIETTLRFKVPPPYGYVDVETSASLIGTGLGSDERKALVTQIISAADRARGLGTSKNDVTGRVDVLRRNGEAPRVWLARLDMAGQMLESETSGYRGSTIDSEDLWTVLEDPEADADLRAAAARVLRHSQKPATRTRIDAAVAAVRNLSTHRRLRIAIRDDIENASEELAMLDAQEQISPDARRMQQR